VPVARGPPYLELSDARDTVIAHGTVAAEIISQLSSQGRSLDTVIVPLGGGGLLSGITSYLADMAPRTSIVGIEPAGAASLTAAFEADEPVTLENVDPFVDGAAVKRIGQVPYTILDANRGRLHWDTVTE